MAPEPLHVDPERLAAAARQMLAAANEMPTPPAQQTVTGSDPLSQAIAAQTGKVEAAITEGLPAVQKDAIRHTENVATAAKAYEQTDREIADRIKRATFPKGNAERHGAQAVGYGTKPERPSGPFPEEPAPGMSRKQAADGLKDVNARIAAHNAELPYISTLPPHDPRRADFTIETNRLNAEKQQYLAVLPPQHPPANVAGPGGAKLTGVPPGLISQTPADTGQGWVYPVAPGQPGIDPRVVSIRVMEPTSLYPNGYVTYMNNIGQEVDPFTGRTVPPSNPWAHIPLPK